MYKCTLFYNLRSYSTVFQSQLSVKYIVIIIAKLETNADNNNNYRHCVSVKKDMTEPGFFFLCCVIFAEPNLCVSSLSLWSHIQFSNFIIMYS